MLIHDSSDFLHRSFSDSKQYSRMKRVGAANWVAAKIIAWGAFTLDQRFNSWVSLSILRSFLGTFKAVRIGHSISDNIHLQSKTRAYI